MCPINTVSGYGSRSRDLVKCFIEDGRMDVEILPVGWGFTSQNYFELNQEYKTLIEPRIINQIDYRPDVWIQIGVPNEFMKLGNFNVGITAGIETDKCDISWIYGCNNMDLIITSSDHSSRVLSNTSYVYNNMPLKIERPIETLFEGIDTTVFKKIKKEEIPSNILNFMSQIKEDFVFLVTGMWTTGNAGYERKNFFNTIRLFAETFKKEKNPPALLMKINGATCSTPDYYDMKLRINEALKSCKSATVPSVYLLHGELTEEELNGLYNHYKIKAMISLHRGEGFGRTLLEFAAVGKPIITSNYSGPKDFLNDKSSILVDGIMVDIHPSVYHENILSNGMKWFEPNYISASKYLFELYKNYNEYREMAKRHADYIKNNFTIEIMKKRFFEIFDKYYKKNTSNFTIKLASI